MPRVEPPSSFSGSSDRGVTLLEMLVVLALISVLFGIGLGVFANLDKNLAGDIAVERLKSLLRMARNSAIRNGSPAYVILDAKTQSLTGAGATLVGQWHFEEAEGTIGGVIDLAGAEVETEGRFGSCLAFGEGGGTAVTEARPAFDPRGGFLVETYVEPKKAVEMTIFELDGSYRLSLTESGTLRGEASLTSGEEVLIENFDHILPLSRWSRVGLSSNGVAVSIFLDGMEIATQPAVGDVLFSRNVPLSVGAADRPFRGRIDELRIFSLATREQVPLPGDVSLQGPSRVIEFDRGGKLNPVKHSGPVRVELATPTQKYAVEVGILGSVR